MGVVFLWDHIKLIRISSSCSCYGPMPEPGDEIEQRLTITNTGSAYLRRYLCGDKFTGVSEDYVLKSIERTSFDKEKFDEIVKAVFKFDSASKYERVVYDAPMWNMEAKIIGGGGFPSRGVMGDYETKELRELDEIIREIIKFDEMYLFGEEYIDDED